MHQNHEPKHIFPPLSRFLELFGHSHEKLGTQTALMLCPIALAPSISVEWAHWAVPLWPSISVEGAHWAIFFLSPGQNIFLQTLTSIAQFPEGLTFLTPSFQSVS